MSVSEALSLKSTDSETFWLDDPSQFTLDTTGRHHFSPGDMRQEMNRISRHISNHGIDKEYLRGILECGRQIKNLPLGINRGLCLWCEGINNVLTECELGPGTDKDSGEGVINTFPQFVRFTEIWQQAQQWSTVWGGVSAWSESLEVMFTGAAIWGDSSRVDAFTLQALDHAQKGKKLLHLIEDFDGELPSDPKALNLLWKMQCQTVIMLATGIATIEARVGVLKKERFNATNDYPLDGAFSNGHTSDEEDENQMEEGEICA
ncbi:hypothetical protein DFP72DRAFT_861623 [Ephemerocybe angulata]|uniref:Uncharacterized protein n=1 Tax=Ephemerocybe angulata TaxID=980116 RepID=A0A8H6LS41_9AGAR|nr:hypothetical protein DFP72DRAFT_861623 [Tulosesus angulatus]